MSIGAFTLLHVVITLVAIGSGLIVVGGMFASHKLPLTTALFLLTTALTSVTGFLFPIHGLTPALSVGYLGLCGLGDRAVCFIQSASVGCMALDLRDHRCRIALLERFCSSRAELCESFSSECFSSDAVRVTIRDHASRRVSDFHSDCTHRGG